MAVFTPHTPEEVKEMLAEIGAADINALFSDIPAELKPKSFNIREGLPEHSVAAIMSKLAELNRPAISFAGGGYYDHFIPAAVDAVSGRAEFFTAYTPYQPEASQGTLRAIFEYQTMVARLTGLPYANASLYDGGTALYEAMAMALRSHKGNKVVVDAGVNPLYRQIIKTYTINLDVEIVEVPLTAGLTADREKIKAATDEKTAAVIMQSPNFFGMAEDCSEVFAAASAKGAVPVSVFYPVALGALKSPAEMGAEIAVADGQSLGMPLSFGGPYLGVMAVSSKYLRKMPGRIVGETVDREGKRAYVLTLQAREQHIKREKATSNICSNQALCSLRAVIYLSLLGKNGFKDLALLNLERAEQLKAMLKTEGFMIKEGFTFNEFPVELRTSAKQAAEKMLAKGFLAGVPASLFYPGAENILIVSATEKRTENEMHAYVNALKGCAS